MKGEKFANKNSSTRDIMLVRHVRGICVKRQLFFYAMTSNKTAALKKMKNKNGNDNDNGKSKTLPKMD